MQGFLKLEHGGGGTLTRELLDEVIIPSYTLNHLEQGIGLPEMDDGATIPLGNKSLVVTTDATTVKPLFFPGGDLGVVKYLAQGLLGRAAPAQEEEMREFAERRRPYRGLALIYTYAELARRTKKATQ